MHAGIVEHVGRPLAEIDEHRLAMMATAGVPQRTMADALGCSVDVLQRRYQDKIRQWSGNGKAALHVRQYMNALHGSDNMLKFLGMNRLGQSDRAIVGTVDLSETYRARVTEDGAILIEVDSADDEG